MQKVVRATICALLQVRPISMYIYIIYIYLPVVIGKECTESCVLYNTCKSDLQSCAFSTLHFKGTFKIPYLTPEKGFCETTRFGCL